MFQRQAVIIEHRETSSNYFLTQANGTLTFKNHDLEGYISPQKPKKNRSI